MPGARRISKESARGRSRPPRRVAPVPAGKQHERGSRLLSRRIPAVALLSCALWGQEARPPAARGTHTEARHFRKPALTPWTCNYIGRLTICGQPARPGDEVAVFDPEGTLCGRFTVRQTSPGTYGTIQVYADDRSTTRVDEGARAGDRLAFRVWARSTNTEYAGTSLRLTPGKAAGSFFVPSSIPPVWQNNAGFVLDIEVLARDATPPHTRKKTQAKADRTDNAGLRE